MTPEKSARTSASILYAVVTFQLVVAAGAPLGSFTQGGQIEGALPISGRILAAISAVLLLLMAFGVLALVKQGPLHLWNPFTIRRIAWFTVGYSLIGTVVNALSRSEVERPWAVVTLAVAYFTYRTLRTTK